MQPSLRALVFLLIGVSPVLACKDRGSLSRTRPKPMIAAAGVQVRDVSVEIRSPVDLRPIAQADVGSKTLGYLDAVLVDRGDRVRRGQLLALVRPSDLPDQLSAARGTLAQTQAAAALARANKERADQLAPSGVVSQQDLQQATAALATTQAALEAAQANVGALAVRLGETRIEAPLDGFVSQRRLDPGALVGPSAGNGAILTLQRTDTLRVFIPINEAEVKGLQVGQDAHIDLDAFPGKPYPGKVVRISPAFDPLTRTLDAEVQLKNPGELRAGMYGRAAIVTAVHPGAVVIPAAAVQITDDRTYTFVFSEQPDPAAAKAEPDGKAGRRSFLAWLFPRDVKKAKAEPDGKAGKRSSGVPGKVQRVELRLGVDGGEWVEVISGLKAGDKIVTAGADMISDGTQVVAQLEVDPYSGTRVTEAGSPKP